MKTELTHYQPRMQYDLPIELVDLPTFFEKDMGIVRDNVSTWFHKLMIEQMIVGFHKYGSWVPKSGDLRMLDTLKRRLKAYEQSGNVAFLSDVANFAMMEAMAPNPQFSPPIVHYDGGKSGPGQISTEGRVVNRGHNESGLRRFR